MPPGDEKREPEGEQEEARKWVRERNRQMNYFLGQVGQRYVAMSLTNRPTVPGLSPGGSKFMPLPFRRLGRKP